MHMYSDELETIQEAANKLHISTKRLRAWLKHGIIFGVKIGGKSGHWRIPLQAIRQFCEENTINRRKEP